MKTIFIHPSFLEFGGAERTIKDFFEYTKNSMLITLFKTKNVQGNIFFASENLPFFHKLLGYKANPFSKKYIELAAKFLAKNWKEGDNIVFSNFPASLIVYCAIKLNPKIKNARVSYLCFEPDKIVYYDKIKKEYLPQEIKSKKINTLSKLMNSWREKDFFIVTRVCKEVIAMSEFVVEQTNRIYEFNKCRKFGECYVNPESFQILEKIRAIKKLNNKYDLNLTEKDKIILSVSRLEKEKGIIKFLEISTLMPEYKFIVAGKGSMSKLARNAGKNQKNLHYLGFVPEKLLAALYSASDIFLFLGKNETGGPFTLLEAMYAGNKIIASNEGSVFEYIVHEKNGLLVNADDTKEVIGAIKKIHLLDTKETNKDFIEKYCLFEKTFSSFNNLIITNA